MMLLDIVKLREKFHRGWNFREMEDVLLLAEHAAKYEAALREMPCSALGGCEGPLRRHDKHCAVALARKALKP